MRDTSATICTQRNSQPLPLGYSNELKKEEEEEFAYNRTLSSCPGLGEPVVQNPNPFTRSECKQPRYGKCVSIFARSVYVQEMISMAGAVGKNKKRKEEEHHLHSILTFASITAL